MDDSYAQGLPSTRDIMRGGGWKEHKERDACGVEGKMKQDRHQCAATTVIQDPGHDDRKADQADRELDECNTDADEGRVGSGRQRIQTANRIFSNQPEGARNGGDDTLSVPAGDGSLTTSARVATELKSEAEEVVGLRKQVAALRSVWPWGVPGLNQTWPSRPRNGSRARPTPRMIRNC